MARDPAESPPETAETTKDTLGGRFQLLRRLARGSSGEVFLALDRATGKQVALKRLLQGNQGNPSAALSFMREFHALSSLRPPQTWPRDSPPCRRTSAARAARSTPATARTRSGAGS